MKHIIYYFDWNGGLRTLRNYLVFNIKGFTYEKAKKTPTI